MNALRSPELAAERQAAALPPPDPVMTVSEVADELRCSKPHVYNAINGKVVGVSALPAICLGRRKLVRRSSLEAWKRANEQGAVV